MLTVPPHLGTGLIAKRFSPLTAKILDKPVAQSCCKPCVQGRNWQRHRMQRAWAKNIVRPRSWHRGIPIRACEAENIPRC